MVEECGWMDGGMDGEGGTLRYNGEGDEYGWTEERMNGQRDG